MAVTKFQYEPSQFLEAIRVAADGIGAPFDEALNKKILDTFDEQFKIGAVVFRTSNQPGAGLDYRSFMRGKTDVMGPALREGFITKEDPLTELVESWGGLYGGAPEASVDFSASKGLAKVWLWFGAIRPVDEILAPTFVPEGIRRHGPTFKRLGLTDVQHIAVDYHKRSINLYFGHYGETPREQIVELSKLSNSGPISETWFKQMDQYLSKDGYPFSVTMGLDGEISRVCFYALSDMPFDARKVDPKVEKFWDTAPSHTEDDFKGLGWSMGKKPYLKTERGYCGHVVSFGAYWGVFPDHVAERA
jgi:4-hydroxyphenylpyruvate 3-dimethylallyltransferase